MQRKQGNHGFEASLHPDVRQHNVQALVEWEKEQKAYKDTTPPPSHVLLTTAQGFLADASQSLEDPTDGSQSSTWNPSTEVQPAAVPSVGPQSLLPSFSAGLPTAMDCIGGTQASRANSPSGLLPSVIPTGGPRSPQSSPRIGMQPTMVPRIAMQSTGLSLKTGVQPDVVAHGSAQSPALNCKASQQPKPPVWHTSLVAVPGLHCSLLQSPLVAHSPHLQVPGFLGCLQCLVVQQKSQKRAMLLHHLELQPLTRQTAFHCLTAAHLHTVQLALQQSVGQLPLQLQAC